MKEQWPMIIGGEIVSANFKLRAHWEFVYRMVNIGHAQRVKGYRPPRRKLRYTVLGPDGVHPRRFNRWKRG